VGTSRRRLLVEAEGGPFGVGPDNGVLTALLRRRGTIVRQITNSRWFATDDTRTFEGRSRFAPAAATWLSGADPRDAGPVIDDPRILGELSATISGAAIRGGVIYVDPFGNLVTSVRARDLENLGSGVLESLCASIGSRGAIPLRATYSDVAAGALVAYVGSTGHLEIAVRGGNAARDLDVGIGAPVDVAKALRGRP
jgi:S-adenosylmethionine hydrolase